MDQQKQIEEIILVVKEKIADNSSIDIDEDLVSFNGNDFDHIAEQVAECIYLKEYRKIPKNAVVLTKEELNDLEYKAYARGVDSFNTLHEKQLSKVRKETAEKFAERLKEMAYQSTDWSHGEHPMVVEVDYIDEILKELQEC